MKLEPGYYIAGKIPSWTLHEFLEENHPPLIFQVLAINGEYVSYVYLTSAYHRNAVKERLVSSFMEAQPQPLSTILKELF